MSGPEEKKYTEMVRVNETGDRDKSSRSDQTTWTIYENCSNINFKTNTSSIKIFNVYFLIFNLIGFVPYFYIYETI